MNVNGVWGFPIAGDSERYACYCSCLLTVLTLQQTARSWLRPEDKTFACITVLTMAHEEDG